MADAAASNSTTSGSASSSADDSNNQPSNSDIFLQHISGFVDRDEVHDMVDMQKNMMMRYEKTNEMLLNFNVLSSNRYQASVGEFKKHTQILVDMKKDLDIVFKRIRKLKQTLSANYPEAFISLAEEAPNSEDDDDTVTPRMSVSDSASIDVRQAAIREEPEPETLDGVTAERLVVPARVPVP